LTISGSWVVGVNSSDGVGDSRSTEDREGDGVKLEEDEGGAKWGRLRVDEDSFLEKYSCEKDLIEGVGSEDSGSEGGESGE
jgi:hypothetical protein